MTFCQYCLREQNPSDFIFLKHVHHSTLKEHVSKIWGWDEEQQDAFFNKDFELNQIQVIEYEGDRAGYLQLSVNSGSLHLINILILPEFQGRGLGTTIIHDLSIRCGTEGLLLKLGVFKVNERAKKLYERLGFLTYGETETHYLMSLSR